MDEAGDPLPQATLEVARKAEAILFGAAGVPGDEAIAYMMRPGEPAAAAQGSRAVANFRPALMFSELVDASTLNGRSSKVWIC